MTRYTEFYYLNTGPNGRYQEVTLEEYVAAERAAGFHPKDGLPVGKPATGGFTGGNGVNGKILSKVNLKPAFKAKEIKR